MFWNVGASEVGIETVDRRGEGVWVTPPWFDVHVVAGRCVVLATCRRCSIICPFGMPLKVFDSRSHPVTCAALQCIVGFLCSVVFVLASRNWKS